ncbi:MAG: hypothetical protein COA79_06300 [Planctomycetota bacterium]|nr:MAG: hypothetical protein COA79_06300 [Planctomycetota bacterium]
MPDAKSDIDIDVGDVLKKGANEIGIDDLSRMGLKKVKVLKHSQIQKLMKDAVSKSIDRFLVGALGQSENERLRKLIKAKEIELTGETVEDKSGLKSEVNELKRSFAVQNQRLEEAKAKVAQDTKKEYERLSEMTSLENQIIQRQKKESELRDQLQESSTLISELKDKLRVSENTHNQDMTKFQDLERFNIVQDELNNIEEENLKINGEREKLKDALIGQRDKVLMLEKNVEEKNSQITGLSERNKILEDEVKSSSQSTNEEKDVVRDKDLKISQLEAEGSKNITLLEHSEKEIANLQGMVTNLTQQISRPVEKEDNSAAMMEAMKKMMDDMQGDMSEKLDKIKIRAGRGGGGGGGGDYVDDADLDPAEVLKSLFKADAANQITDSNIAEVGVQERTPLKKKDLAKNLKRLKALKDIKKD